MEARKIIEPDIRSKQESRNEASTEIEPERIRINNFKQVKRTLTPKLK